MLRLTNTTLNIQSFMGAIMAIGIAVANSILLVSFAERFRHENRPLLDAAREGASQPAASDPDDRRGDDLRHDADGHRNGRGRVAIRAAGPGSHRRFDRFDIRHARRSLPSIYAILQRRASTASASLNPLDPTSRYYDAT